MIFFFKLQIHSFAREARFPKDKCANFWGYYQDRRILFPRLVTEWSLKLFSSEQNCFDDQMRESVKYKNTEHVEGVTRSDVRTVNKWPFQTPYLEIIWLSLLSLASASPPSPTPISHFPSCRTGISPGAKVTQWFGAQGYSGNVSSWLWARYFGSRGWESSHILQKCLSGQMCSKCQNLTYQKTLGTY